jgi:uroporphyrin-III C-methyltransferase
MKSFNSGTVCIAGAGPGDEELITIKLQKRLVEAEVIITDRLVNPLIIEEYARKDAEIIFAGKQGYNEASVLQQDINQVMVQKALSDKKVLRLKGGDVAFFSNVLDELKSLTAHGIEFEIIPGVTAASGASAYAGIPLTARGFSQGVQVLTFNPSSMYTSEKWKQLALLEDTLVFYMASQSIFDLTELLLRYTHKPTTPLAVIEQATTVHQQVHVTTLKTCAKDFEGKNFTSPSLVIVGKVVRLNQQFNWYHNGNGGSIFKELTA